jgi:hypothetical protein
MAEIWLNDVSETLANWYEQTQKADIACDERGK